MNSGFIICFAPGSPCVRFTKSHSGSLHCVLFALWDESQEGVGFSQQDRLRGHPLGQPWRAVRRLPAASKDLRRVCAGHFLPAGPSRDQTPAPVSSWLWGLRGLTGTLNSSSSHTPGKAVFAGSMQLLAGVKLCTGRALTNHPHYEDSGLRERTRAVSRGAQRGLCGGPAARHGLAAHCKRAAEAVHAQSEEPRGKDREAPQSVCEQRPRCF